MASDGRPFSAAASSSGVSQLFLQSKCSGVLPSLSFVSMASGGRPFSAAASREEKEEEDTQAGEAAWRLCIVCEI